jgi:hypothetical protein
MDLKRTNIYLFNFYLFLSILIGGKYGTIYIYIIMPYRRIEPNPLFSQLFIMLPLQFTDLIKDRNPVVLQTNELRIWEGGGSHGA